MRYTLESEISVRCYAGYKGDERPVSLTVSGRTLRVEEIKDRWYDPDANYFRVVAEDKELYLLRHDLDTDVWTLRENF